MNATWFNFKDKTDPIEYVVGLSDWMQVTLIRTLVAIWTALIRLKWWFSSLEVTWRSLGGSTYFQRLVIDTELPSSRLASYGRIVLRLRHGHNLCTCLSVAASESQVWYWNAHSSIRKPKPSFVSVYVQLFFTRLLPVKLYNIIPFICI